MAIDLSEDNAKVIAVIGIQEHILKQDTLMGCTWIKHFRRIPSRRKKSYLRAFERRFKRILKYIEISRVFTMDNKDKLIILIKELKPSLIIIDNKLYQLIEYRNKLAENRIKSKHLKTIMLLADNFANYARYMISEGRLDKVKALEK